MGLIDGRETSVDRDLKLLNTRIIDDYSKIQDFLDGKSNDNDLDFCIKVLREDIGAYLYESLKTNNFSSVDDLIDPELTEIWKDYKKNPIPFEEKIFKNVLDKDISIDKLLKFSSDLKKGLIKILNLPEVIVPTENSHKSLVVGSGSGFVDIDPVIHDKFQLLYGLLSDMGVDMKGVMIYNGVLKENMMRKESYRAIVVPSLNKTIFVNNSYGEATFIYDGVLSGDEVFKLSKDDLNANSAKFIFFDNDVDPWLNGLQFALLNKQPINIDINLIRTEFQKPEIRYDWFTRNTSTRRNFSINCNGKNFGYVAIARLSTTFDISNYEFKSTVRSDETFIKISENIFGKADTFVNILKNKGKFVDFLRNVYEKFKDKLDPFLTSSSVYKKNFLQIKEIFISGFYDNDIHSLIKEYFVQKYNIEGLDSNNIDWCQFDADLNCFLNNWFPVSYEGLIGLLGGNDDCLQGRYLHELLKSKEDGDNYFKVYNLVNNDETFKGEFISFLNSLCSSDSKDFEDFKGLISSSLNYKKKRDKIMTFLYNAFSSGKFEGCFENTIKTNGKFLYDDDNFKSVFNLWMPKSFDGLIAKLGGNKKCLEGGYLLALLKGKGAEYFENWEYINENQEKFVSFLKDNWNKIDAYLSSEDTYNKANRENMIKLLTVGTDEDDKFLKCFKQWFPGTFKSLIYNLGGNTNCKKSNYVKFLLKGGDGESFSN